MTMMWMKMVYFAVVTFLVVGCEEGDSKHEIKAAEKRVFVANLATLNKAYNLSLARNIRVDEFKKIKKELPEITPEQLMEMISSNKRFHDVFRKRVASFLSQRMFSPKQDARIEKVGIGVEDSVESVKLKLAPYFTHTDKLCENVGYGVCFSEWLKKTEGYGDILRGIQITDDMSYKQILLKYMGRLYE